MRGHRLRGTIHRQTLLTQITQPATLTRIHRQRHTHITRGHHQPGLPVPRRHNHRHPSRPSLLHRPITRTVQRLQIHGTQRRLHTQTITLNRQIIKPHRTIRRHRWRDTQLKLKLRHHTPLPIQNPQTHNHQRTRPTRATPASPDTTNQKPTPHALKQTTYSSHTSPSSEQLNDSYGTKSCTKSEERP